MTDLALRWSEAAQGFDIALDAATGDLVTDDGLTTAVLISLFTDARAAADDTLPDPAGSRRGWWGDAVTPDGRTWGSKLWLLRRAKCTAATAARARSYAEAALAWLITDRIAARVDVVAEAMPADQRIALGITIVRPSGERVEFRWRNLWEAYRHAA